MSFPVGWIVLLALAFLGGAYIETKYPHVNLIGKVVG